ncbi:DUF885 family protein [Deinococcus sp. Leaf326]|uniref:DUF885 family protein n=1 Tax=Deinococcus sp. Leaf326 TaxID=1736338 RepID=UPI0006FA6100|nr:DUF885 family protein [Deinococcus sp. Leaf326]KQR01045.1 hypothetical protein ASF71_12860 [Deinococcus sp. Leaf326]
MTSPSALVDRYLAFHGQFRPVDLTFMGLPGHDHRLPPAGPDVAAQEGAALETLQAELEQVLASPASRTPGEQTDLRLLDGQLRHLRAELDRAPRFRNPAWYTGEAAFGLISLLLPRPDGSAQEVQVGLQGRLEELPRFFGEAAEQLVQAALPADWSTRAAQEARALARFLSEELWLHPDVTRVPALVAAAERGAAAALHLAGRLQGELSGQPDVPVACGEAHLELLMRQVHGLPFGPREALARAEAAFMRLSDELTEDARAFGQDWREVLRGLDAVRPEPATLVATYEYWHRQALEAAEANGLVTGAQDYDLTFTPMPAWARQVSRELYFLFYRSPAAARAGQGSVYWVVEDEPLPSVSFIKLVHAVHHGSVGHHTQNAFARRAESRLARLGGTDGALGLVFLSSGTAVEGWACYAEDLLLEAPGFYTPEEALMLKSFERRNAACCVADLRLHMGDWSLEDMRDYYRAEVGFPEARVWGESTRNSMLPATRLMYWLGTEQIRALRAASPGHPRAVHDWALSHGHAPIHWLTPDDVPRPLLHGGLS